MKDRLDRATKRLKAARDEQVYVTMLIQKSRRKDQNLCRVNGNAAASDDDLIEINAGSLPKKRRALMT